MTPQQFIAKWEKAGNLSERSGAQQHFLDLCELLGQPTPAAEDPDGAWYTFERGVRKTGGGSGWADVWMRGHFGWEYKKKRRDLAEAYQQLLRYREDLDNPPLLVVCDLDRFEVHTNFTGTAKRVHAFDLKGLEQPENLDVLRRLFADPESLRPGETTAGITQQAAACFGKIADSMRVRTIPAPRAAHFLMKLMFCMFAEDIGLLPGKLFSKLLDGSRHDPPRLARLLKTLFEAMANGGDFGPDPILHFNGGLFADADVIEPILSEIDELRVANTHDWAEVEPSIFGTLFERTLDPAKRSQIGAHYTSREDILTLLEPVVMTPLRREWADVKAKCEALWPKIQEEARKRGKEGAVGAPRKASKPRAAFDKVIRDFVERLAHLRILDPACGSGNFLYVSINLLLDLEKEVNSYAAQHGLSLFPQVRPTQLAGIEINPYAQELAQVVIWIGYLQWMHHNGFAAPRHPVLDPIESIRCQDAIIDLTDPTHPIEPDWPETDFIVGNPPFVGGKRLRAELGDDYVDSIFRLYDGRVPHEADLVAYWFEKSRRMIDSAKAKRCGLLATQSIRAGANRRILEQIRVSGEIFMAISDQPWILDGAAVRVSIVGFDDGTETHRSLDGVEVATINANLTSSADVTAAQRLVGNLDISYMGDTKGGPFDIGFLLAKQMVTQPANPNGHYNSDVLVPWVNGLDITRRNRGMWIVDFGTETPKEVAALYEMPFEYVQRTVMPERLKNNRATYRDHWWIHVEPRPAMRLAIEGKSRFIATSRVAKHRVFVWVPSLTLPDSRVYVFARDDDYLFGILHSRMHEIWSLATSSRHGVGNDPTYNNTTCFETFPFPESDDGQREAIAAAAKELDRLRTNWLNPPEWTREEILEFPGSVGGPWARYIDPATIAVASRRASAPGVSAETNVRLERHIPREPVSASGDAESRRATPPGPPLLRGGEETAAPALGVVRYPRLVPRDEECAKQLAKRTLTNLYNQRPTWLALAHRHLDEAVATAYGWPPTLTDDEILERLLALNLSRASD